MSETTQTGVSVSDVGNQIGELLAGAEKPPVEQAEEVKAEVETEVVEAATDTEEVEETKAEEETQPDATEEEATEDEEGITLETFEQLEDVLGLTADELLSLPIKTKVDGEESAVSLSELVKSHQLEKHVNAKSIEASEIKKEAQEARDKHIAETQQRVESLDTLAQNLALQIQGEGNIDHLIDSDPEAYLKAKARREQQSALLQQVQQEQQKQATLAQEKQNEQLQAYKQEQIAALPKLIPEWKDAKVMEADFKAGEKYLAAKGFTSEEMSQLMDARLFAVIHDAQRYQQYATQAPVVTKKLKIVPKVTKPGKSQSSSEQKAERRKAVQSKAMKSGNVRDMGDAFAQMLQKG
ncbi:MAG: hypothetical protein AAF434_17230 [Pseudomonadota bacterium]